MKKPNFEFAANSENLEDKSGIATWRYTNDRDVDIVVQQVFQSFKERVI